MSNISNHVSEIAISSSEQSSGLAEINTAVNQLDQVTQQNAAMFEETTAASHALTREAENLSDTMSRFQTGSSESNVVAANFQSARNAAKLRDAQASVNLPKAASVKTNVQAATVEQTASTPESEWEDF